MSTHADPTKDEYLELEKKLGFAESELAADLADADEALEATAGRSDLNALSELVRAQSLSHR